MCHLLPFLAIISIITYIIFRSNTIGSINDKNSYNDTQGYSPIFWAKKSTSETSSVRRLSTSYRKEYSSDDMPEDKTKMGENIKRVHSLFTAFEKYPPKRLASLQDKIFLSKMAKIANLPYCDSRRFIGNLPFGKFGDLYVDPHTQEISAYFKGPEYTTKQWNRRKSVLKQFEFGLSYKQHRNILVDNEWYTDMRYIIPDLFRRLINLVSKRDEQKIPVFFIGHGIGGAYAVMAALAMHNELARENTELWKVIPIVATFGQPRIGVENFALIVNHFNMTIARVTHANDSVPRLHLPKYPFLGFRHHGTEFWIPKQICECDDIEKYQVFICPVPDQRKHGENPECNSGQRGSVIETEEAHRGPYFGITMGNCELGMEGYL
ncbi:hypothetical protein G9A89_000180 [Geosiphon pyriformis]|nr:hypothetical protein G9A89_000180 [Geosiphon pyriformis]